MAPDPDRRRRHQGAVVADECAVADDQLRLATEVVAESNRRLAREPHTPADDDPAASAQVRQLLHAEAVADGLALAAEQRLVPEEPQRPAEQLTPADVESVEAPKQRTGQADYGQVEREDAARKPLDPAPEGAL